MNPRGRLLIALASTGVISYIAVGSLLGRVMGDTTYGQLAVFNEVIRIVVDAYVEPVNLDRAMSGADLGITDALDGDSAYLEADDFRAYQQPVRDSDADVGVLLSRRFGFLMVISTREGSPAQKAGLKPGDLVKTIDGRHSRQLAVPVGERLLRGDPGSIVKLRILRGGTDPIDLSLVRERLRPAAPKSSILEAGYGYLKIPEFQPRVVEEVRSELESLKKSGAQKLVLDLRGSAFGQPSEAVRVAELFMKGGVVAKLKSRRGSDQILSADPSLRVWDLPMTVLINTGTAGPGEIVAAALAESGRASTVGEHTFGRAGIQRAFPLPAGGIVLTVSKYLSPKGEAIHGRGIAPGIPVEVSDEDFPGDKGEDRDPILKKGLESLKAAEVKKAA